jgi:FMN phosphatase YigB (HAD superfamily)
MGRPDVSHLLQDIRVIVYDLDGTLYEDTSHFDQYARLLAEELPADRRQAYLREYEAACRGDHRALRIGTWYHAAHDLVLHVHSGRIGRAVRWDGTELTGEEVGEFFPDPVAIDHETVMNVGDLWWIPVALSAHYGGTAPHWNRSFLQVREILAGESFTIRPTPGLRETIQSLQGRVIQVMMTNSPQPDSEAILRKVGLYGLFDRMCFRSNKPAGVRAVLDDLVLSYGVRPEQILSVGDNLANEIQPARQYGARTVFLDAHGIGREGDADLVIDGMVQFLPHLRQLAG